MRTLKEIAIELLEKYERAEEQAISEFSFNVQSALGSLEKEIEEYRKEIEEAAE